MLTSTIALYKVYLINRYVFITISSNLGWGVLSVSSVKLLTLTMDVSRLFFNLICISYLFFKIKGFGFKFSKVIQLRAILIRINVSNKLIVRPPNNIKTRLINKKKIYLFCRDINYSKN